MKTIYFFSILFILGSFNLVAQDISAYVRVGTVSQSIGEVSTNVIEALKEKGFKYKGTYNPENSKSLKVIAFTRQDLYQTCLKSYDRGALAAILKVSLIQKGDKVEVSYLNPDYIFHAYLRSVADKYKVTLNRITADFKSALKTIANDFEGFGGEKSASKLHKYHYMMSMPYFTDPIKLKEFSSFEEGVLAIEKNLKNRVGNAKKVYSLKFNKSKIAVYGVALPDQEKVFLPKIGKDHIAAMPYEIILQGKTATMLHGRYRIALHWPKLSMGQFMKIMSTPGDIKKALENLTK